MDDDACNEHDSKRRKGSEQTDADAKAFAPMRANDAIALAFANASAHISPAHVYHPEYTHQIFENEEIGFIPVSHPGKITIHVDCRDLSQSVSYSSFSAQEVHDISTLLQKALPDSYDSNVDTTVDVSNNSDLPPGRLLYEFTKKLPPNKCDTSNSENSAMRFEVWLATAKDARASELLHRAEKLALWYIETADSVDFSDDRWEAIFLYSVQPAADQSLSTDLDSATTTSNTEAKHAGGVSLPSRSFVGYMTLFSFRNPFRGTKLRVCQALVLPHMQAAGLGREMLLCVYKDLVQGREEVSELTVEDPAPGFQRMRDSVDFQLFSSHFSAHCAHLLKQPPKASTPQDSIQQGADVTTALSDTAVASALKIIKSQAQFLVECVEYLGIVREIIDLLKMGNNTESIAASALGALESHEKFKAFRLKVKRRILKNDKDLAALTPKTEMQRALAEEFVTELKRFQALESTAARLGYLCRKFSL